MKKLTVFELHTLHKMGLINQALLVWWSKKNRRSAGEDIRWQMVGVYVFLVMLVISIITLVWFITDRQLGPATNVVIIITFECYFLYKFLYDHKVKLGELNNLFSRFNNCEDDHYWLNRHPEELTNLATKGLNNWAGKLREMEIRYGVDSTRSVWWRKRFKNAHALLVPFQLCSENQGFYLDSKPVEVTTPTSTPPPVGTPIPV